MISGKIKKYHVLMIVVFLICSLLLAACDNSQQPADSETDKDNGTSQEQANKKVFWSSVLELVIPTPEKQLLRLVKKK